METEIERLRAEYRMDKKIVCAMFIVLGLLCLLYLCMKWDVIPFAVTVCLIGATIIYRMRDTSRQKTIIDCNRDNLNKAFYQLKDVLFCCGAYLDDGKSLNPVTIIIQNGSVAIVKKLAEKNFIYENNQTFWYIWTPLTGIEMEMNIKTPQFQAVKDHQTLLREMGIRYKQLDIMEYFLYGVTIKIWRNQKAVGKINMGNELCRLKDEQMYCAKLENGSILYVDEVTNSYLKMHRWETAYDG